MKHIFIPYIYIVFFLWNFGSIHGQKLTLKISAKDSIHTPFINAVLFEKKHSSKISLFASLDSIKNKLTRKGFFNVSLDSIIHLDSIYHAKFNLGNLNKTVRIYYSNTDIPKNQLFSIVSSVEDTYFDVPIEDVSSVLNAIVRFFEARGNSFTQVFLKNIVVQKNLIEGSLKIEKSTIRKINKVVINGYKDFPKPYLLYYLKIKNNIFSKKKLANISKLINVLPFASETKPPEVLFTNDSTIVYLYLKKKISNKFDGLIGFTSKENGNGILFNGYLDLSLHNIFDGGESFSIYWKNNGNERQVFNLSTTIPYIFNSRFSPKIELDIYKQDSTYINTKTKFSVPYTLNEKHALGISLQTENSSNLLTNNNSNDIDNYNTVFYGINYNFILSNKHILFPTKFNLFGEVLFGQRKVENSISTSQSILYLKANYLWSLNFKNHIFFQNESSIFLSDNMLTNELFRIGGVNSIRGFNEESIFASTYSYFNIEYRFNANNSSYFYSITDVGYIDSEVTNQSSQIYSLGLGYAFTTKLGLLNFSYAVGKFSNLPFDISNSRFHIKIISFF